MKTFETVRQEVITCDICFERITEGPNTTFGGEYHVHDSCVEKLAPFFRNVDLWNLLIAARSFNDMRKGEAGYSQGILSLLSSKTLFVKSRFFLIAFSEGFDSCIIDCRDEAAVRQNIIDLGSDYVIKGVYHDGEFSLVDIQTTVSFFGEIYKGDAQ